MVSIPARYLGYYSTPPSLIQLQIDAQSKRKNYGKSKQIYFARNKWSKILAKSKTDMGAPLPTNCDCGGNLFYQNGKWYCQTNNGVVACPN